MLMFKLARVGKKKQPTYRLVVVERSKDPWGKVVEVIGLIAPLHDEATRIDAERVKHWISKGAQATDTVWNLFLDRKLVEGAKRKTVRMTTKRKAKLEKEKKG
jgi:small subunit ribosomal protein S16